ncbi:MAG: TetR/AcrR family transcriptional regulator [Eggerthellaceae bacterium]|nr:TetR/AcrR family transcriptional regulator [Eggerthellaceae bacterium]
MANKDPERRAQTRKRIMDAYWDLYASDPPRNVTVSAVIAKAGVHRSTFYEYFADADAVLVAIEDELAALFEAEAIGALSGGNADPAAIVQRVYVKHGDMLSVLLGDAGDQRFARRVKEALKPAAMQELDLAGSPFSPYLFEFAATGLLAAASLWYERGCDLEPGEFGNGIRATLMAVMSQANVANQTVI